MASINSVVKRKQFIWLGIVLATVGWWWAAAGIWRMHATRAAAMRQPPASLRPI